MLAELSGSRAGCVTSPLRLLHYGFPSPRSTCTLSPIRGSCTTFPCRSWLAQGSCATLASLSQGWLCSIPFWKCSPSRCSWFSATWLSFQGHVLLSGALSPQWLCCATSDRLLRPNVPRYLQGIPATLWDQWCFAGAPFWRQLCRWSLTGPSGQAIVPYWPCSVSLPRCSFTEVSSTMSPQRCFQDYVASDTQGYEKAPMKGFLAFLLWLSRLLLSCFFWAHVNSRQCCPVA